MTDFSNKDRDVFIIKLDRMIDRGALMSRYSRTANLDLRDVYEKEFATNPDRGKDFYKRVFTEYGDESIAELVTAQLAMQNISNIATKIIEEQRIGLSYLEKSSRYVNYDVKRNGNFLFLHSDKLGLRGTLASDYDDYCNELFETYSSMVTDMQNILGEKYPFEESSVYDVRDENSDFDSKLLKKSYERAMKSRIYDEARNLLPASTLTNLGISGNGRAFLNLILKLRRFRKTELESLANSLFNELQNELPELIDTANKTYSETMVNYAMKRDAVDNLKEGFNPQNRVELLDWENEESALKHVYYARDFMESDPIYQAGNLVSDDREPYENQLNRDIEIRTNRRHKPGRWFEFTGYTLKITTNFGSFRDLQRHRMMTVIRKRLSPLLGFDTPPEISLNSQLNEIYSRVMHKNSDLWKKIRDSHGEFVAQYCVPFGFKYQVLVRANLRELCYFTELRSTPQAHYDLRHISQDIYRLIREKQPQLSRIIKFVDQNEYTFGRLKSEIKKEGKLRQIDKNGSKSL